MTEKVKVWYRGKRRWFDPDASPKGTRELRAYLIFTGHADCFAKLQGGYYKIGRDGVLRYVVRALYLLSFKEWAEIAADDNFIENQKV